MRAGKLRHRLAIQEPVETRDDHGGITRTWSTVATVWGSIETLTGRELYEAQQVEARATVRIRIRSYSGLSPLHRLVFTEV